MTNYNEIDFEKFTPLQRKESITLDEKSGRIDVPQSFLGIARGPVKDIRFMCTTTFTCVALALVWWNRKSVNGKNYPNVILAHIDDAGLEDGKDDFYVPSRTQSLVIASRKLIARQEAEDKRNSKTKKKSKIKEEPISIRAYVDNGDLEPLLLGRVIEDLEKMKVPFELNAGCYLSTLAIDLIDGKPVRESALREVSEYKACQKLENLYHRHIFSFPRVSRYFFNLSALECAFDLTGGIPAGYSKTDPEVPLVPRSKPLPSDSNHL